MSIQDLYDHAIATSKAYRERADRLAEEHDVCTHPEEKRVPVTRHGDEGSLDLCTACGRELRIEAQFLAALDGP